jgi:hypothetical protein
MEMGRWMIAKVHLDHDSEEAADAGHRSSLASWLDGAKVSVGMAEFRPMRCDPKADPATERLIACIEDEEFAAR